MLVQRTCELCHKEFFVKPSQVKIGSGRFCSRLCKDAKTGGRVSRKCLVCGKEFTVSHSVAANGHGLYCSPECTWPADFSLRFWSRVDKSGGPKACWPYGSIRRKNGGYGIFVGDHGEKLRAHRVAYELTHGQILPEFFVLHRCENKTCCNPTHLHLGRHKENIDDAFRARRTYWLSTLMETDIRTIRDSKETGVVLAARYGVSRTAISRIKLRQSFNRFV